MALKDRVAQGAKLMLVAQVANVAASGLLVVLLTRYLLTPAEYGLLFLAVNALGVAAVGARLGVPHATARYVTEYRERAPGQVPHLLRTSAAAMLALVVVVGGLLAVLAGDVARLVGEPALVPFLLAGGGYVGGRSLTSYCSRIFQAYNEVGWSAAVKATSGVTRLGFTVAFVLAGYGPIGALFGYVAGFWVAGALGAAVLYWGFYRGASMDPGMEDGLPRRLAEYSVPLTATQGANVLDKKVDVVLVGALVDTVAVGFYTVAKQVSDFAEVPAASFGYSVAPAYGEQKAADRSDRAARLYERAIEGILVLYIPACIGLVLVADPFVPLVFGADYAGAVPVLQVMAGFVLVNAVNKVTGDGLDYLGRARVRAIAKGTMAVANVGLNLLLIPRYGAVGAAVASVATYVVYTGSNVYWLHRELDVDAAGVARTALRVCAVSVLMAAVVLAGMPYVSGLVTLLAVVAVGVAVWGATSVAAGLLDPREVASLLS